MGRFNPLPDVISHPNSSIPIWDCEIIGSEYSINAAHLLFQNIKALVDTYKSWLQRGDNRISNFFLVGSKPTKRNVLRAEIGCLLHTPCLAFWIT